jgi:RNA polymerase sigma factor (sigma-70 family)
MRPVSDQSSNPLDRLLARNLDLVYAAALRQVRDPHLAEDVAQNVFLIALRKNALPEDRAGAWLLTVTRYGALNMIRGLRRREHYQRIAAARALAPQPEDVPMDHDAVQASQAIAGQLDAALTELRSGDRRVLVLRYLEHRSVAEVAATLGIAANAASQRIGRALERLRGKLARRKVNIGTEGLGAFLLAGANAPAGLGRPIAIAAAQGTRPAAMGISLGVLWMTASTKMVAGAAASVIILLALLAGLCAGKLGRVPADAPLVRVEKVEIAGNVFTSNREALAKVATKAGGVFAQEQVDKDIAALNQIFGSARAETLTSPAGSFRIQKP